MRKRQSSSPVRPGGSSPLSIVALEKRIAFDGAAAATAAKVVHKLVATDPSSHAQAAVVRDLVAAHRTPLAFNEMLRADAHDAPQALRGLDLGTADRQAQVRSAAPKSVVFIESDVPDIAGLIKDVDHSAQIVLLDSTKDGVDAIASYLAAHKDVKDVYIFSHGSDAQLDLGTATLDAASMQGRYAGDLATIKASLAPGANILVYGCDFALGTAGDTAANLLSQLTGAAVAASTDLTGGTAQGGNFVLEDHVGAIDAPNVLSAHIAADYVGLLAAPTTVFATSGSGAYKSNLEFLTFANTSLATNGITNGATATYATAEGGTVTITFGVTSANATNAATYKPAAFNAYAPSKFAGGYNNTSSSSEQLYGGFSGSAEFTVTFSATDKNGNAYKPNVAFADSEVTENTEFFTVTTTGGAFQSPELVGATGYSLTGLGTQSFTLKSDAAGVPLITTTGVTTLDITNMIGGGKEGFALALIVPTLSLDKNASSGAAANNYQTTFTEKGGAVAIADTDTNAVEPGLTNASSATIVLTNAQAGDALSVGTLPSGITSSIDTSKAGQVTVTLSGASSLANYDAAIHAIAFSNSSSNPATVDRNIAVTFNDGSQTSNTAVSTVHVTAVNDAPVETVPAALTTNKDTALSISGLSVSDIDANGGTETVTLSVADGTISLASTAGLTFSKGTGTNDTTETFTGTLSAINNAIATVKYQPTTGFSGSDTLSFSTNDNGNTGSGGAMTASKTVGITVNNVNPTNNGTIANQRYTDGQANISIATSQAFSDSLGLTLTYSATGLPKGLAIDPNTGKITGTVDHDASTNAPAKTGAGATLDGTYTVVETASDGQGGTTTQTFTIDSTNQAPVVGTKTANQTNNDGATIAAVNAAAAFSDPNGDPLTYTATGLPAGLAISAAGSITGTVAKNATPGTYSVVVTGTDDKGAATSETFSWVINDVPPVNAATLANQTYTDGQTGISIATSQGFSDANGNALTYSATNLPAGLSINASTGQITGTISHDASKNAPSTTGSGATLDGKYTVTETASDGLGGSTSQTFTIDSTNQAPVVGTKTADQTNNDGATITAVNAAAAFSDPNGDPLTYTATNLPAGLTISASGMITGTVAHNALPGAYSVVVTGTDDKGAATAETFTWTIKDVPPITNGTLPNQTTIDGQAGIAIATSQAFTPTNGNALTYSASGLPAGLSIDPTTGKITGTVDHDASKNAPKTAGSGATLDGTYSVVVTASDGLGGTAMQSFTLDSSNGAPVVGTATPNQMSMTGQTIANVDASKAFSDPNGDPLTYSAFNLPQGLTIDPNTGIVSGTVAANAKPGTYAVRILATDDKGAATREVLNWTVTDTPPTANGTLANKTYPDATANINIATAGGFTSPNGLALTYTATGLPKGLSIDPMTGAITGQLDHDASKNGPATSGSGATLDGTYTVNVMASDGQGGTAQQVFKIDATNNAPTLVAQTPDQTGADGQTVSLDGAKPFQDQNTGDTFTYAATGLPTGLSINPTTGLVSGTIDPHASQTSPFSVTITITDDKGAATSETFHWTVNDVPPVATPTLPDQSVDDGTAVTVTTAGGFTNPNHVAYTYTATGLPSGLAIDPNSGVISGTINHDASVMASGGVYAIAVTANDGQGGTATNSFHLTSSNQAPVVGTKTASQGNLDGDTITPVDASKAFTDPNGDPLTYTASALPAGLVIDPNTGIISGMVSKSAAAGAYSVAITATDDKGLATTEIFAWTIGSVPPQPNGTIPNQMFADGTPGIAIATSTAFSDRNGNTLSYSATGLPAGLSIDPTTGKITGTLDHDASTNAPAKTGSGATLDGTYTIVVTTADGIGGTATQTFTIDATNQAPAVATNTPAQTNTDGDVISVNAGEAFLDPNTGDLVTYAATNLPTGLTIDPKTGVISGTVQTGDYAASPYTVVVTATDDKGAATTEMFQWTIMAAPTASVSPIPNVASFDGNAVSIDTGSHFTMDGVTVYSATGLPAGLSINPTTGVISGTLDHDASVNGTNKTKSGQITDSVYSVTVTAMNMTGSTAQVFALDVANQAPVVGTVTANQSNKDGDAVATVDASQAFSDPNGDPLTYSANNLPPGLAIDSTGKITGTVAGNAFPGDYKVTVTATDDKGAASSEVFTWTIADVPPTANGTLPGQKVADGTGGISITTAGGFTPTNGNALYYAATGLPPGLTIDPRTGVISGAIDHDASQNAPTTSGMGATLDGTYAITVTAYDGLGGSAVQMFAFDATNTAPAIAAQTADQHGQDRQTVSLATAAAFSDANGDPLTFSASNLPTGLSIDPATGLISGTIDPAASVKGPYTVSVTATDDKGAKTTETFMWAVDDLAPQATPPLADRSINDGTGVSYATSGGFSNPNNATLAYSATGLPTGLSIDPATGLISGTLDHNASAAVSGGVYTVAVTVDDGQGGTATNTFHFTASNQAPVVTTPLADESNQDGDAITPVDASKAFGDPNPGDTLSYLASNLPKGLAIDPATGVISGTIAGNAAPGSYYVTVTATDNKGAATPANFTWFVGDVPPVANGTLPAQHFTDSQNGIGIPTAGGFTSPNGLPLTYSATGLPAGLSIDPNSGAITGFVGHNASLNAPSKTGMGATLDGTYTVVVTANDGQGGTATQSFKLDSTNQAPTLGKTTADQHDADGQQVSLDANKSFSDPNTGDTLTFTASGLPAGLTINPATGLITGTIDPRASTASPYTVTVTATDNKGAATPETFRFVIDDVPPTAGMPIAATIAPDGTTIAPIATASHFDNPNGLPLTYAVSGLPKGLSIDPASGQITGTLDHDASKNAPVTSGSGATLDGTYTVTVTASDGQGGVATQMFTFDATNTAPAIVARTADQQGTDSQAVSLDASKAFADPNKGDILTYVATGLPKGLTIDPATGLITGTIDPRASANGPYTVIVTATDDKGAATNESFAFAVADLPPMAGTIASDSANDGSSVSIPTSGGFSSPNGIALSYSATGLPAGLSIDPASGVISGTLSHDASIGNGQGGGLYTIVVTASDGQGGSASDSFYLTSSDQAPVVGTPTANQSNADGATVTAVDASKAFSDPNGDPLTFNATNLPAGLTIDPQTGLITGTVSGKAAPGSYGVIVTAADDKGATTTETFTWTIADVPPTAAGSIAGRSFGDGTSGVAIDTAGAFADANGNALTYSAMGLPAGLSIDPKTGVISGTVDHDASANAPSTSGSGATLDGTYHVTVTASDGLGGSAVQTFVLDARNAAPVVGNATADQSNTDGDAVSVNAAVAFADPNTGDILTYTATNLPRGLTIDPQTGLITGQVASGDNASSPYTVTVTATDDKGAATSETLSWTILPPKPGSVSPLPAVSGLDGTAVAIDTASHFATNGPTTYAASGLPAGLSIDPTSGRITGTLDHDASKNAPTTTGSGANLDGIYTVVVTARNAGGVSQQQFTLDSANQAPIVGTKTVDQSNKDGDTIATVDASQAFADPNGDPLTYAATNLPAGLAIDPMTGQITGTVARDAQPGTYQVAVTATDDKGASTTETFAWNVGGIAPIAGTLPSQHYGDGQGGIVIETASGFASPSGRQLSYAASGLPAGLSINPATGVITGTLGRDASSTAPVQVGSGATFEGIYAVTITATDPFGGTSSQVFAIEVGHGVPELVAQTPAQHGLAGQLVPPLDLGAAFVNSAGDPLTYAATGLPPGLAFDPATGRVTGIIDPTLASPRIYTVTVTATDARGDTVAETFLYSVDTVPPSILTPRSFFGPLAALQPSNFGPVVVGIADLGHNRSEPPLTPVLDVISETSGEGEHYQVISLDGIVVSTVNGVAPLDGLQPLSVPGAGIVRSGAATDERGDRFERTQDAIGRGIEALSTPLNFLGATSIDVDAARDRTDGPPINIETMLRDNVLSISVGSGAGRGDPLARVTVTLADGRPLPSWLRADGRGYIVGRVPGGVERIDLKITSTFESGATSQRSVTIRTDRGTITPLAPRPHAARTLSHMVAASRSMAADVSRFASLLD